MIGGQKASIEIVTTHGAIQLTWQLTAPHHKWNLSARQLVEFLVLVPLSHHNQASHATRFVKLRQVF